MVEPGDEAIALQAENDRSQIQLKDGCRSDRVSDHHPVLIGLSLSSQNVTGDLDGDGDVDKKGINIISSFKRQPASACPECDIDGDGTITILDARKAVGLCALSGCVSP